MPLPFILGGLAVATGVLGAAGHAAAKDDNEEAQRIARKAEKNTIKQRHRLSICRKKQKQT